MGSPSPTLAPSTSTSPSSPRSRATTLVCPRRDPSSLSTTATKRRMTRNRKIHPDNPNSIFLLTKKEKDLQHVRGGGPSGRTLSANTKKHKTAPPSAWRPEFLDPAPVFGQLGFFSLGFLPSPLLPSDFAGASHFQLVHIHKIKSKWSLVFLLCFCQTIRITL